MSQNKLIRYRLKLGMRFHMGTNEFEDINQRKIWTICMCWLLNLLARVAPAYLKFISQWNRVILQIDHFIICGYQTKQTNQGLRIVE